MVSSCVEESCMQLTRHIMTHAALLLSSAALLLSSAALRMMLTLLLHMC